ncbi:unnamed protein product [Phyllotreta striolata]|uniref:Partial AB-hydrolase lipase domain-containing protein n=1 Tax=Phyllotreta striolata TaxID=444603 RepID=A0A9N9TM40_PHYSR|nr:unnamed protein product [Phyllotreta striolata]
MWSFKQCLVILTLHYTIVSSIPVSNGDLDKTTPEMIADEGYPVETHHVTTSDGYILCLHRIPKGKNGESNKKVVFLQHGLLTTSSDWILFGPEASLGYMLADKGYDVWMGNTRGNTYSRNHTKYNPDKDGAFWQFSWNEMGEIDLPTMIDYILQSTGVDGIHYVGHSQGTTSFFVMASEKPEYNSKIKVHIALAPIAYMKHITSPLLKIMAFWEGAIELLFNLIGENEFLPQKGFLHLITETMCSIGVGKLLCENTLFALCGFSLNEMNMTRVPLIMHHTPAGASTKQLLHYAQEIDSGHFRKYDFGLIGNLGKYGSVFPPNYDLGKVKAPVYLIFSHNDWLAGLKDVDRLQNELGNFAGKILVSEESFNHLDFTYVNLESISSSIAAIKELKDKEITNNEDLNKTTPEMITDSGYPVETHYVTTSDGYILCLHRIVPQTKKDDLKTKVIFLQHGILASSSDWILFGPGNSLGYILADQGWDIWMGNARGNVYSRRHTTFDPDIDAEFWDFSWHEIGEIDLPAMIDYVLDSTKTESLYYVGHSQGNTAFYVMASEKPEYNSKIKLQVSLSPVAFLKHMTNPLLKAISIFEQPFHILTNVMGVNEFFPDSGYIQLLAKDMCSYQLGSYVCENIMFVLCGFNPEEISKERVPLILHHSPAGISKHQLYHFAQGIKSGQFRKYDFGVIGNLKKYGKIVAPDYELNNITAPVYLIYANNDRLANIMDVERLYKSLGNCKGKHLVEENSFSHIDFLYGVNSPELVHKHVVNLITNDE